MKIPVFVSSPTALNADQNAIREAIFQTLTEFRLEHRALGQSDYPTLLPLKEVLVIAKHCAGALILGFEQQFAPSLQLKRGLPAANGGGGQITNVSFPTPWNNLEGGILYTLNLPMLVFREPGITGGIFDKGVSDVFIHNMPKLDDDGRLDSSVIGLLLKWQADVRRHYYR